MNHPAPPEPRPPDEASVLSALAAAAGLPVDQVDLDDNLLDLGIDSITLMGLVDRWRADGVPVGFADLAGAPSVGVAVTTVTAAAAGAAGAAPTH